MIENRIKLYQDDHTPDPSGSGSIHAYRYNTALNRFNSTLFRGGVFRFVRKFLNRKPYLFDLNILKPDLHVQGSFYAGIKAVPVHSIIGSEGRTADFDMEFHPLSEEARERWVSVAVAYLSRLPLPPIQLIQVGDAYFVRDGHHRLSVSRAFGQMVMDAEVITWNASPPFPWQMENYAASRTLLAQES